MKEVLYKKIDREEEKITTQLKKLCSKIKFMKISYYFKIRTEKKENCSDVYFSLPTSIPNI